MSNGMLCQMMQRKSGTCLAQKQNQSFCALSPSKSQLNHPILQPSSPLQGNIKHHHYIKPFMSMNLVTLPHVFMNFMGETHHLKLLLIQPLNLLMMALQCMKTTLSLPVNLYWPMSPRRNPSHLVKSKDSSPQMPTASRNKAVLNILNIPKRSM